MDIKDNVEESRFQVEVEGNLAVAEYVLDGKTITFTHTVVPAALEGRGIGSALAKAALTSARERGLAVVPQCPFIRGYLEKHPELR
jgi:predicted GNAT family acetyltransferase